MCFLLLTDWCKSLKIKPTWCTIFLNMFISYVSGDYVSTIRRNNCIYAALGTCYSVWMAVWYAGWNDGHTVARNM